MGSVQPGDTRVLRAAAAGAPTVLSTLSVCSLTPRFSTTPRKAFRYQRINRLLLLSKLARFVASSSFVSSPTLIRSCSQHYPTQDPAEQPAGRPDQQQQHAQVSRAPESLLSCLHANLRVPRSTTSHSKLLLNQRKRHPNRLPPLQPSPLPLSSGPHQHPRRASLLPLSRSRTGMDSSGSGLRKSERTRTPSSPLRRSLLRNRGTLSIPHPPNRSPLPRRQDTRHTPSSPTPRRRFSPTPIPRTLSKRMAILPIPRSSLNRPLLLLRSRTRLRTPSPTNSNPFRWLPDPPAPLLLLHRLTRRNPFTTRPPSPPHSPNPLPPPPSAPSPLLRRRFNLLLAPFALNLRRRLAPFRQRRRTTSPSLLPSREPILGLSHSSMIRRRGQRTSNR